MQITENSIFENIRDKSKYTFLYKFNKMTPDDTNKKNRSSLHKDMKSSQIQKLSKGTFKYLIRVYNRALNPYEISENFYQLFKQWTTKNLNFYFILLLLEYL